ncbi:RNA-directed RNA polymerase [Phyllosticta capitalensis]|uniref:RNA-dependent RNA polymerase n=1 Tax=Phyllosticta capitalensis TaxID=121624 RepID=A0ABR1YDW8_9PEZI
MDVAVHGIPTQTSEADLSKFFKPILEEFGILAFNCHQVKRHPLAFITIVDPEKGRRLIKHYGTQTRPGTANPFPGLLYANKLIKLAPGHHKSDEFLVKCLRKEEAKILQKASAKSKNVPSEITPNSAQTLTHKAKQPRAFGFSGLWCGVWDFDGSEPAFAPHFQDNRRGVVLFGRKLVSLILRADDWVSSTCRIDMPYWTVDTIVKGSREQPTVTFTLRQPPKIYRLGEGLNGLMSGLGFSAPNKPKYQKYTRTRVSSIDDSHASVVGSCWVYQITLEKRADLLPLFHLINQKNTAMPTALLTPPGYTKTETTFEEDFRQLKIMLRTGNQYGGLKFAIKFQVERLARNAYLPPAKIIHLLPTILRLSKEKDHIATANAIKMLAQHMEFAGPHISTQKFSVETLTRDLVQYAKDFQLEGSPYDLSSRHSHMALVHRVVITPTGIYLEGPQAEVSNRVLRKYPDHTDHFVRVQFQDEDGDLFRAEARTDPTEIYHNRFKDILNKYIDIGGHSFQFLGFSHSSLRAQTCWFMAPFIDGNACSLIASPEVIKGLGDFSKIQSPAKCAARIGQAFSDTRNTVSIPPQAVRRINDVVHHGHTFSDGVGTISAKLLKKVWRSYERQNVSKPTCLQIRFAGAKGMLSLDTRIPGEQMRLRTSMIKFTLGDTPMGMVELEICNGNFKSMPMYLNRQFIKILEDLGVPAKVFLDLQHNAVEELRMITKSPVNAATFLENGLTGEKKHIPFLIQALDDIGLYFNEDSFLHHVIEVAALSHLRDLKHRGRIPVEKGVTLFGIMDETGFLEEGEIYCTVMRQGSNGKMKRTVYTGEEVVVTRSPAMHPGDIQKARPVDVPPDSPLNHLNNVVVFSQKGSRDLPSQLSGGDLDGDLYNIIFDRRLIPHMTSQAADYTKKDPINIGRAIERKDIANFFVQFMETDQLGRIAMIHMQLADRQPTGTHSKDCLKLAEMASTAVDFSKTGHPVDMNECPRYDMIRPDFMAPGPRVFIEKKGIVFPDNEDGELAEDDDDEDPIEALDPDYKTYRYYESERVLGQLYRAIDEKKIFQELQMAGRRGVRGNGALMERVWAHVRTETQLIQWAQYQDLAKEIRDTYESNLLDIMSEFSPHPQFPLSELEVFGGNIIGKSNNSTSQRMRNMAAQMRERFEHDVAFTVDRITQGNDGDRNEALARAIACLSLGMQERSSSSSTADHRRGRAWDRRAELRSWRYVAAAVVLRELDNWRAKLRA